MQYLKLLEETPDELKKPLILRGAGCVTGGDAQIYAGAALKSGGLLKERGISRVFLMAGRHFIDGGDSEAILKSLKDAGISWELFTEVPPEPHIDVVYKIIDAMSGGSFDAVIGIGGGSVMDMAKLAAHNADGRLSEKIHEAVFKEIPLPLYLLPTTSGTGSEVSPFVVLTKEGKKVFFNAPTLFPYTALIDPLLTCSMPKNVTAATAFDAMTHALEGATGRSSPYCEALAAESTSMILTHLPALLHDGFQVRARYMLTLASVMGMTAYAVGGGLYAHSISYILTLEKNTAHGIGCGLSLPYTLAFNYEHIKPLMRAIARRLAESGEKIKDEKDTIAFIQDRYIATGLPESLKVLGYKRDDARRLSRKLLNEYPRAANPRKLDENSARLLFEAMTDGEIRYI